MKFKSVIKQVVLQILSAEQHVVNRMLQTHKCDLISTYSKLLVNPIEMCLLSPKVAFFYFLDTTDYSAYTTLNWGAGGIDANKIEQVLQYPEKHLFSKCVGQILLSPIEKGWKILLSSLMLHSVLVFKVTFSCKLHLHKE